MYIFFNLEAYIEKRQILLFQPVTLIIASEILLLFQEDLLCLEVNESFGKMRVNYGWSLEIEI